MDILKLEYLKTRISQKKKLRFRILSKCNIENFEKSFSNIMTCMNVTTSTKKTMSVKN